MKHPFFESVQDTNGNVLSNANVYVYLTGTTTPAKVYDVDGNLKTTAPQMRTNEIGFFYFSVDDSDYNSDQLFDIKITKSGYTDLVIRKVKLIPRFSDVNSSATDIDDAVSKKHAQDTDQYLDKGGANEVAVADVKDAVNKRHAHPIPDSTPIVKGSDDSTKKVRLEVDGLTTGTTRVITIPDKDITPADKEEQAYTESPMIISGGEIAEGTNAGTFKVSALTALLRTTDSPTGKLEKVTKDAEDNISIPSADTTYFVCLNYNSGSPTISLSTSNPYEADKRSIPIGKVRKDSSNNIFYLTGGFRFQDGIKKSHQRAKELREIELERGSTIAYSGTNNFTMETGVAYSGLNRFTLPSYDSATTQFTMLYRDGSGGWTEESRNTIDYSHYDDGSGTLADIGNNRYGCHYVFRHVGDGHVYVVLGTGSYTLAEAVTNAVIPPERPSHLDDFGCLIGCIVAPKNGGEFTKVVMITSQFFSGTEVANHANLSGLDYESSGHTGFAKSGANDDITSMTGLDYINGSTTNGYLILRGDSEATDDFKLYDSGILDLPKQSGCRVHRSAIQSIPNSTWTKVNFDTEDWDIQSEFDSTTNYRFTSTKAGKYLVSASILYNTVADGTRVDIAIAKNGIKVESAISYAAKADAYPTVCVTSVLNLSAGDYVEIETLHDGGTSYDVSDDNKYTWLTIHKIH